MTAPLFDIQNLSCAYSNNKPVLYIPKLELPKGKLIFLIGKSGIGKSTLVETLGAMNNTTLANSNTKITFTPEPGTVIPLENIWQTNLTRIQELRKKYFSFIFQNTNLMPNFSCGENMMVGLLIEGKSRKEAKARVLKVMDHLSLDHAIFDKDVKNISVGQRQRLAFIRAITSDFTVLFGDEPTGNLDFSTSLELMKVLKQQVEERRKTCIIVSHNLQLATLFGDIIIPMMKMPNEDCATIEEVKILKKTGDVWQNINSDVISNPHEYLKTIAELNNVIA